MQRYLRAAEESWSERATQWVSGKHFEPEASIKGELNAADGNRGYAAPSRQKADMKI
jgi:hypothetical protein